MATKMRPFVGTYELDRDHSTTRIPSSPSALAVSSSETTERRRSRASSPFAASRTRSSRPGPTNLRGKTPSAITAQASSFVRPSTGEAGT